MTERQSRQDLASMVSDLDETGVLALVRHRLESGDDPLSIIADCERGMYLVGERYERHEYFLAGLIMAGEIFQQAMDLVHPSLERTQVARSAGLILIGTVQGDIHTIGKGIVQVALRCHGFTIEDLGIDVPPRRFLDQALALQPDLIGLSGILTTSFGSMRETVRLLRQEGPPAVRDIPVIIGGGQVNEDVCRLVGADYWASDGIEGVRICRRILRKD